MSIRLPWKLPGCVYAGQKTELILEPHQAVPDHDRSNDTGRSRLCSKQEDTDYVRIADPDPDQENNQNL